MLSKLNGFIPASVLSELAIVSEKYSINTPLRLAHFLSQCSHESNSFTAIRENLNYSADGLKKIFGKYFKTDANIYARNPEKIANRVYANRMGNGSESTGDGFKYRGRGFIQLTGKDNYKLFGSFIGSDLISNPDLVATKYPLSSAAYFFKINNILSLCDKGFSLDVVKSVTKKINGGLIGIDDRWKKFNKYYDKLK